MRFILIIPEKLFIDDVSRDERLEQQIMND
jgi:hypothetical protein